MISNINKYCDCISIFFIVINSVSSRWLTAAPFPSKVSLTSPSLWFWLFTWLSQCLTFREVTPPPASARTSRYVLIFGHPVWIYQIINFSSKNNCPNLRLMIPHIDKCQRELSLNCNFYHFSFRGPPFLYCGAAPPTLPSLLPPPSIQKLIYIYRSPLLFVQKSLFWPWAGLWRWNFRLIILGKQSCIKNAFFLNCIQKCVLQIVYSSQGHWQHKIDIKMPFLVKIPNENGLNLPPLSAFVIVKVIL